MARKLVLKIRIPPKFLKGHFLILFWTQHRLTSAARCGRTRHRGLSKDGQWPTQKESLTRPGEGSHAAGRACSTLRPTVARTNQSHMRGSPEKLNQAWSSLQGYSTFPNWMFLKPADWSRLRNSKE